MTIWFTSDPHYFHANVIKYCNRPFGSKAEWDAGQFNQDTIIEMNETMIRNWNEVVKPEDEIYCLGDFSLAFRPVELYSSRLMGKKYLIPGNHDFCHGANKKSRNPENKAKWISKYREHGWTVLPEFNTRFFEGLGWVNLTHMPYKGDSTDERFQNWRMADDGKVLLCGHIHSHWLTKSTSNGTLMVNVGVDVWNMKPVSLEQLVELVNSEKI